ncbi:MAG: penicillin-binding protein 2 [Rubellimicrobium sp.]|nr:penicillin-binding protein 2 [Rubellimicrobium sp.]
MRRPPKESNDSARRITRRSLVLGAGQLGVIGVLGWRMHEMQVEQAEEFRFLAEENRISLRLIPPERGMIFDMNGVRLAVNEQVYRIVMLREDAGNVDEALARLRHVVTLEDGVIERAREEVMRRPAFVPVTIVDRVNWEDIARVSANAPALPGIFAEVGLSRMYPLGADTAHVVGYVGPVSDSDLARLETPDPVLRLPRFQIGKTGVENRLEDQLRGSAGTTRLEVNAVGRVMRELGRVEGTRGANVQLTIDSRLQSYVEARMEGESAAAIVMDCDTGNLLAVGNAPSFDPNLFVRGISVADWRALNENRYRPLAAKAVQGTYPPGSTFKMVTALAAFEAGVVTPEETVRCPGHMDVSGHRFHCWRRGGHGNMNFHESLKQSCDVYYYEIAQRVGIDAIAAMARKLGIGVRPDIEMSALAQGLAPDRAWKQSVRGESWRIGDTVNASIGQGYVLSSPLQLAIMTARLATGRNIMPRLVHKIDGVEQPYKGGESLGLNENDLRRVRASMYGVCNHERGTAFGSRIVAEGMRMAGKTGTSQVRRITAEERARGVLSTEDLPWERRNHALWVNYAPDEAPKFAVAVVVEHGGGGSSVAAPIGRDITLQALYDGPPPLEAYPANVRARIAEQQERIRNHVPVGGVTSERA